MIPLLNSLKYPTRACCPRPAGILWVHKLPTNTFISSGFLTSWFVQGESLVLPLGSGEWQTHLGPLELPTYPPFVLRTQFCLSSMSRTGEVAGPSKSKQSPFPLPVTTLKGKVSRKALYFFPTTLAVVLLHAFTTGWLGFVLLSAMAAMSQLRGPKLEGKTQTHRARQNRNVIKSNKCPYSVSPHKPSICYLELKL